MKKIASALAIIVFLFGVVSVQVAGQDASTSLGDKNQVKIRDRVEKTIEKRPEFKEKREQLRERLKEKRETLRGEAKEKRGDVKQRIPAKRADKIKEFSSRIKEKLLAMVERLEKLAERIQSRINKLAEKGADTAAAQSQLDEAKTKLASVKTRILGLEGVGADIASSDSPKEMFGAVKEEVQAIKKDLVEVHRILASSLGKVKGLSGARDE